MSEYLTTGQAAELLGVSKPTVVRAIQRGLLRPALVTPGQHRRFRKEDLLAFRSRALAYPEGDFAMDANEHGTDAVELKGSPATERASEASETR
ncbi:MAG: helix-turn-helix domain-containing protein [Chloroflexi bacterium]|nr:MAG: helix-turn-helix domain-containing protein [Chloroflexota bacterium]